MRCKPWLTACCSLLLFACATAAEPLLTATLVVGSPKLKRALELKGLDYTITVTRVGLDGKPAMTKTSGTLDKGEYRRLLEHFNALDLAAFKELYTGRDLDRTGRTTTVRVSCKGATRTVTIIGPPPPEAGPLLDPLLPLLDRTW